MKISIFSAFYPFRGGIAQFNARLVEELVKKNEVSTFTFKKQYPNFLFPGKTQYVESLVNTDAVPASRIVSAFNPFSYFSASKRIKRSSPEIFITNYWMTFFGPFMGWFGRSLKNKSKRIAILHNLIPHEKRFFDQWCNRYFLKHYDGFVVLSEAVKQDLLLMKPDAKFLLIEHPLYDHFGEKMSSDAAIKKLGIEENKKIVLFFGIIRDYKGLDNLIKAMSILSDDYQLVIAGEVYGDAAQYDELIASTGKSESIYFFNQYIADDEVNLYFSAADLCVLPYRTATQSGITAISHYFDVPVLATNVGGLKETIEHKKTGFIIEKSDPTQLAEGINSFFNETDPQELKLSIQQLKKERSWETFTSELLLFSNRL